ncbi:MAG: hypothetical protein J6Y62_06055 [Clostridia bacterium]|nr:hypothetical protein [Clostridia bacterium]
MADVIEQRKDVLVVNQLMRDIFAGRRDWAELEIDGIHVDLQKRAGKGIEISFSHQKRGKRVTLGEDVMYDAVKSYAPFNTGERMKVLKVKDVWTAANEAVEAVERFHKFAETMEGLWFFPAGSEYKDWIFKGQGWAVTAELYRRKTTVDRSSARSSGKASGSRKAETVVAWPVQLEYHRLKEDGQIRREFGISRTLRDEETLQLAVPDFMERFFSFCEKILRVWDESLFHQFPESWRAGLVEKPRG